MLDRGLVSHKVSKTSTSLLGLRKCSFLVSAVPEERFPLWSLLVPDSYVGSLSD